MKVITTILVALAAVTFPIYLVIFIFKGLVFGIFTVMVTALWLFGQLLMKISAFANRGQKTDPKQLGR